MTVTIFRTSVFSYTMILTLSCTPGKEAPRRSAVPATPLPASGTAATAPSSPADTLNLESNTQATIEDVRIGAGNFWVGEYAGSDGKPRTGPSAALWIYVRGDSSLNQKLRVGADSRFSASRFAFEVLDVGDHTVRMRYSPLPADRP
jgi:hypothetical protein